MNPLNSIKMHVKGVERGMAEIKTEATRKKAQEIIDRLWVYNAKPVLGGEPVGVPAETVRMAVPEAVVGDSLGGAVGSRVDGEMPVEAAKTAVEMYQGNPVCEPVTDYEVGEAGPGVMAETVTQPKPKEPEPMGVKIRDGFPERAIITVASRCINPKLLAGRLEDGRQVSVERGFRNWKVGDLVECELLRSGGQPLYRQLNTRT